MATAHEIKVWLTQLPPDTEVQVWDGDTLVALDPKGERVLRDAGGDKITLYTDYVEEEVYYADDDDDEEDDDDYDD